MKTPSITVAVTTAGKHVVLYCGDDAGKAKECYSASATNPDFDGLFLIVRPDYTRRSHPRDSHMRELAAKKAAEGAAKAKAEVEAKAREQSEADQPKRKAAK